MKRIIQLISLVLLSNLINSCGDDAVSSGNDIVFPEKNVSYYEHVHPYMKLTCAYAGCHSASSIAGGLVLETHIDLMSIPLFVLPGDPENSILVQKLDGRSPFKAYCYQGYVKESVVTGISKWIEEGAQPN